MEIYNEAVRDLLSSDNTPLRLLDDPERGTVVEKLTEITLKDRNHLKELLSVCEAQRKIGETALNEMSSRSHQILRLTVESSPCEYNRFENSANLTASVNFVDLAGSERASQTMSAGARLKEGCHINRSLLTLGTVIRKLSKGRNGHVPYRDSKLTRILQNSLGGNARTAIICTMSPAHSHVEQSRNTLLFASCAKNVCTNAHVNVMMSEKSLIKQLQRELARLENQLKNLGSISMSGDSEALREKELLIEKMDREIRELTQQRDQAHFRLQNLAPPAGEYQGSKHWDEQSSVSELHEKIAWFEEYPASEASEIIDPFRFDSGSSKSHFSDRSEGPKSNNQIPEPFEEQFLSDDTSPRMVIEKYFGPDPTRGWEKAAQEVDLSIEDTCKEVQCIEVETSANKINLESAPSQGNQNPQSQENVNTHHDESALSQGNENPHSPENVNIHHDESAPSQGNEIPQGRENINIHHDESAPSQGNENPQSQENVNIHHDESAPSQENENPQGRENVNIHHDESAPSPGNENPQSQETVNIHHDESSPSQGNKDPQSQESVNIHHEESAPSPGNENPQSQENFNIHHDESAPSHGNENPQSQENVNSLHDESVPSQGNDIPVIQENVTIHHDNEILEPTLEDTEKTIECVVDEYEHPELSPGSSDSESPDPKMVDLSRSKSSGPVLTTTPQSPPAEMDEDDITPSFALKDSIKTLAASEPELSKLEEQALDDKTSPEDHPKESLDIVHSKDGKQQIIMSLGLNDTMVKFRNDLVQEAELLLTPKKLEKDSTQVLDGENDLQKSPSNWPMEFEKQRAEIIQLWDVCNIALAHRSYFYLVFKGDPMDAIYMEVELRRLSYLKSSQGTNISSMKAIKRERETLSKLMLKKFSTKEREALFLKWGIDLKTKKRRLQLCRKLWTDTKDMEHIKESAALVAKLVGYVELSQVPKEIVGLSFSTPQVNIRSFSWKNSMPALV
ncbi:OLC1v1018134C1 [Oldenlandia corymbosa var. corymbosa]|nr:OLC1v1018134C1 [Oldenlandia corymbosa var. corymbosa]